MDAEIVLLERIVFVLAMFLILKVINKEMERLIFMSNLKAFLAQNVEQEENVKYVASKRFLGEDKKPVEWEIQSVTSEEDELIRKSCTKKVLVPGKKNQYTQETDFEKYLGLLAVRCTVFPNLNDAELQNSYGVMGGDAVLKVMLKPGEYQDLLKKIQEINGFDVGLDELVEEVKN